MVINMHRHAKEMEEAIKLGQFVLVDRNSKWGNPYSHMQNTLAKFKVDTREEAIEKYKEWILTQPELLKALPELRGKTLGCWCKPLLCHGSILAEMADNVKEE
jgi:hypothetical protein